MTEFDYPVKECPICKERFVDLDGKYFICPECENEYADFDSLNYVAKRMCKQPIEFELNQLYEVFFPTREEMEAALDYVIRYRMGVDEVAEKCVAFCRQDPHWYHDWVVAEIKKRRNIV